MKFGYIGNQENKDVRLASSFANGAFVTANSAASFANGAFTKANNALPLTGGTLTGDLIINANTTVNGVLTITGTGDNAITFADGTKQYTANSMDAWVRTHANNSYDKANSGATFANASFLRANSGYGQANSAASFANGAFLAANSGASFANGAFDRANAAYAQANTGGTDTWVRTQANNAYDTANSAGSFANGAFLAANSGASFANGAFDRANAAYNTANNATDSWVRTQANNAYDTANSGAIFANGSFDRANAAYAQANTGGTDVWVRTQANNAYDTANSGASFANGSFDRANAAYAQANTGGTDVWVRTQANNAYDTANSAGSFANGAFTKANNALPLTGGTLTGDLIINANTTVNGVLTITGTGDNAITFSDGTKQYTANSTSLDVWVRTQANNAYDKANSGATFANASFLRSNSGYGQANSSGSFANGAFVTANSGASFANGAFDRANAAYNTANNATDSWVRTQANNAYDTANAAYAWGNHASAGYATTIYVSNAIANLVNSAPVTLDTLNELAAALGNDANFSTTITTTLGITNLFANGAFITANAAFNAANNATDPWVRNQANNAYDTANSGASFANGAFTKANNALPLTGGTISGSLIINANTTVNGVLTITGTGDNAITFSDGTKQYTANTSTPDAWVRTHANNSYDKANSSASFANGAFDRANAAYNTANNATDSWVRTQANNAYDTANSGASFANGSFVTANSGAIFANGAFARANAAYAAANTNTGITYTAANSTPVTATIGDQWYFIAIDILYEYINDGTSSYWVDISSSTLTSSVQLDSWARLNSNGAYLTANTSYASQNITAGFANGAFTAANSATTTATSGASFANGAFTAANSATTTATSGASFANGAFTKANNALPLTGGTISGDVSVTGNLTIVGYNVFANTGSVWIKDNIITLNAAIDQASAPAFNAGVEVDRGSSANTYLLWNESTGKWTFTDNSSNYFNMADAARLDSSYAAANSGASFANGAFLAANAAYAQANSAASFANSAFITANSTTRAQSMTMGILFGA